MTLMTALFPFTFSINYFVVAIFFCTFAIDFKQVESEDEK